MGIAYRHLNVILCVLCTTALPSHASDEFFEKEIRPVLARECYSCHSRKAEALKGELYLDSRKGALEGGRNGPAITPGAPETSRLIHAIRHDPDAFVKMPWKLPRLSDATVEAFVHWVKIGAPWGDDRAPTPHAEDTGPEDYESLRRGHWAWRPVERQEPPLVERKDWVLNDIDRFIVDRLSKNGLEPSPIASKAALIRRAYFDLIGLAPTYDEVQAFVHDESPDAFATLVDHLLSLPQYGERWGRHWLDVARYADGDLYFTFTYTYRDYVIRAFNEDLAYDRFILEQLAADLIDLENEPWRRAATGFLALGPQRRRPGLHEIVDDQIDATSRAFMGLTVSCARCHSHKYDPIPTEDYYSLYGVFASSVPLPLQPTIGESSAGPEAYQKYQERIRKRLEHIRKFETKSYVDLLHHFRSHVGDYLVAMFDNEMDRGLVNRDFYYSFRVDEIRFPMVRRWHEYVAREAGKKDSPFALWHELDRLNEDAFATEAATLLGKLREQLDAYEKEWLEQDKNGDGITVSPLPFNHRLIEVLAKGQPKSMRDVARIYGTLLSKVYNEWVAYQAVEGPIVGNLAGGPQDLVLKELPDPMDEELRQVLYGPGTPTTITLAEGRFYIDRRREDRAHFLKEFLYDDIQKMDSPPRALVYKESAVPHAPRVFVRGNPNRPGKSVPRQFLALLTEPNRKPFTRGSGRLELAQAIANRDNPLTARVLVNRVWMHHFGQGLVDTPSDFGTRCQPPSHPRLLDYLAWRFMDESWSIKNLHRWILLSRTYQQASTTRPEGREVDPDNRLLWKMNQRRLEMEAMRDTLLQVSGLLDKTMGGRAVGGRPTRVGSVNRRTVYCRIQRGALDPVLTTFDFPSPRVSSEQRPNTTVPQQALFFMNSPTLLRYAENLIQVAGLEKIESDRERVRALYRQVFSRDATSDEEKLALDFIGGEEPVISGDAVPEPRGFPEEVWLRYAQALLLSNEFLFVD